MKVIVAGLLWAVTLSGGTEAWGHSERQPSEKFRGSKAQQAAFRLQHPCPATGKTHNRCPGYRIGYVVPLKCFGLDHPENMQWLTTEAYSAKVREETDWCKWSSRP